MNSFAHQISTIVRSKLFVKLLLEFVPLGLFLVAVDVYDIYVGSVVLAVSTLVSMVIVGLTYRQFALMALITGITGILAATATFILVDPMWVKLKPTIVSGVFAAILALGLILDKPLLRPLIGEDLNLTDEGWRVITRRWMIYFVIVAVLNELVWRGAIAVWGHVPLADQVWATYKVTFLIPFTILYAAIMLPLLTRFRDDHTKPLGGGDVFAKGTTPRPVPANAGAEDGATPLARVPVRSNRG